MMATVAGAAGCALAAFALWTAIGFGLATRLFGRALAWPLAAPLGWAVHSTVALALFSSVVPWSTATIALVAALVFIVAAAALRLAAAVDRRRAAGRVATLDDGDASAVAVPALAWLLAVGVAVLVAAAILPKHVGDAVVFADPIFDHSKVAMIQEMARSGVPAANPFVTPIEGPARLVYYYLLHFSAAELTRLVGVDAWSADVAMTFFAAFTALTTMMALAVRFGGRAGAAVWVAVLAACASSRPVLVWLVGGPVLDATLEPPGGLGGWLFQSSWPPQHVISTTCVLLSMLLMQRLVRRPALVDAVVLGLLVAAGFESSTWVGGVVFALAAIVVVPWLVITASREARLGALLSLATAGLVALALCAPFIVDQLAAATVRQGGTPIALDPYRVLGDRFPDAVRHALDPLLFWPLLLPLELGAACLPGFVVVVATLVGRRGVRRRFDGRMPLALTALVALAAACLLRSTLADNNDLAWRAALVGATLLIVFAAAGLARHAGLRDARARATLAAACVLVALSLPESVALIHRDLVGTRRPGGDAFVRTDAMWRAVREHSGPDERVASNPHALADLTPWPINIGWSLLADRRSCYAGWDLAQVFSSIPHPLLRTIDARFVRVFDGTGTPDDLQALATPFDCRVAVVTRDDGAWTADPFAKSPLWRRVDATDRWRIYRRR